jgi:hypothetical protein
LNAFLSVVIHVLPKKGPEHLRPLPDRLFTIPYRVTSWHLLSPVFDIGEITCDYQWLALLGGGSLNLSLATHPIDIDHTRVIGSEEHTVLSNETVREPLLKDAD